MSAPMTMSKSLKEASLRAKSLYRSAMRSVPLVMRSYELEVPPGELRSVIRERFRKQLTARDPAVIDVLCYKGEMELAETLQMWKTKAHILKYLSDAKPEETTFEREFYRGYQAD